MIRALVVLLAVLSCTPGLTHSDNAFAVLQRDGSPVCSAFAVGPNSVMTSAHCVDDAGNFSIVSREAYDWTVRGAAPAFVVDLDHDRDLAWLHTTFTFGQSLQPREPVEGEPVKVVSAFAGWKSSAGRVLPGYGFFRDTDVSIQHGWSGSPVIGWDGRVVGVVARCWGTYVNGRHICLQNDMQFAALP